MFGAAGTGQLAKGDSRHESVRAEIRLFRSDIVGFKESASPFGIGCYRPEARVMKKVAQLRVAVLLRGRWGANAGIDQQADGGLRVHLSGSNGTQ
ncbi:MAG TPA: hypothetical protein VI365_20610 [Trebonia sp.]